MHHHRTHRPVAPRRTGITALAVALAATLVPASSAAAQTPTVESRLADVAMERIGRVRADAGLPPLERRADVEQPSVAWAAWLAPVLTQGGQFRTNPDSEGQLCCTEDRPGDDPSGEFGVSSVEQFLGSTTTSDGTEAAFDRILSTALEPGQRMREVIEAEDFTHVGIGVATAGDRVVFDVTLRSLPAAFGTPPASWPRPTPLPVSAACPDEPAPTFRDVDRSSVHAPGIGCVAARGITTGVRGGGYDPGGSVTRAQMASFLVRLLEDRGVELPPQPSRSPFSDTAGSVHEPAIERLNEAGIARGGTDGTYDPGRPVTRQQMATFLVRTYEHAGGSAERDVTRYDFFVDDWQNAGGEPGPGSVHGAAVQRAAEIGVATGRESPVVGYYGMDGDVKRDQMASFLSRLSGAIAQL